MVDGERETFGVPVGHCLGARVPGHGQAQPVGHLQADQVAVRRRGRAHVQVPQEQLVARVDAPDQRLATLPPVDVHHVVRLFAVPLLLVLGARVVRQLDQREHRDAGRARTTRPEAACTDDGASASTRRGRTGCDRSVWPGSAARPAGGRAHTTAPDGLQTKGVSRADARDNGRLRGHVCTVPAVRRPERCEPGGLGELLRNTPTFTQRLPWSLAVPKTLNRYKYRQCYRYFDSGAR